MVNQRIWMHRYAYACVCARSRLIVQFSFPPRWIGNGIEFQLHSNSIDQIHSHRTRSAAWCRPPYQFIILLFNSISILISYRSMYAMPNYRWSALHIHVGIGFRFFIFGNFAFSSISEVNRSISSSISFLSFTCPWPGLIASAHFSQSNYLLDDVIVTR